MGQSEEVPSSNGQPPPDSLPSGKRFHLVPDDLVDAWKAQRRHSTFFKVYKAATFVGLGFFALVSAFVLFAGGTLADAATNLVMLAIFGSALASIPATDRWRAKRMLRQQKSLQRELSVSWNSDAITWASPNGFAAQPWDDYWKCVEGKQTFVFLHSAAILNILPKRLLNTDEVADLRTHLTEGRKARRVSP